MLNIFLALEMIIFTYKNLMLPHLNIKNSSQVYPVGHRLLLPHLDIKNASEVDQRRTETSAQPDDEVFGNKNIIEI
jgi:hypothetical protein